MALLKQVLAFHVTNGLAYSSGLTNNMLVDTLDSADKIRVNIYQKSGSPVVTVDGALVTMADQNATNGVIHVIDHVMYPLPSGTIPLVAAVAKQFGTLVYALQQGQLIPALEGKGPFTVFAPNNAAFDKLPPNALSDLLSNQTALI
ncbi:BGH3-like protein, partial [Mya arenaria]